MAQPFRPLPIPLLLAIALMATSCQAGIPTKSSVRKAGRPAAVSDIADQYQLFGNSRVATALELSQETAGTLSVTYATEAQVLNAVETANAAVMVAAEAEAKAAEALGRAAALEAVARDALARARSAGDASDIAAAAANLAKAQAEAAAAAAGAAEAKAATALSQAGFLEVKAQRAFELATSAGDAAAQAAAAAVLAETKAQNASVAAAAAAAAAAATDARTAAADGKAADAATQAQQALAKATDAAARAQQALDAIAAGVAGDVDVLRFGAKGDGVTDDTTALQAALNATQAGEKVVFPAGRRFLVSATLKLPRAVHLVGYGAELVAATNGMDVLLLADSLEGFTVRGLAFNDAQRGRTCIDVTRSRDFTLEDCRFSGYSAEFAYYKTDSAVRVSLSSRGKIVNNRFVDFGGQYAHTDKLARCVTLDDNAVDYIEISGNTFRNVSQGIVVNGGLNNMISKNVFEEVRDNCLYVLNGTNGLIVDGNVLRNGHDEGIVLAGSNIVISNNTILECPNRAIALAGSVDGLTIQGNIFKNASVMSGSFFAFREPTFKLSKCQIQNNTFIQVASNVISEYFSFRGDVEQLIFTNNNIEVATAAFQRILYFAGGRAKGLIADNTIKSSNVSSTAVEVASSVAEADMAFKNNTLINTRGIVGRLKLQDQVVSGAYITSAQNASVVWSTTPPTFGTWNKGDMVWNSAAGPGAAIGWICTGTGAPGTWSPFGVLSATRTITTSPAAMAATDQYLFVQLAVDGPTQLTLPSAPEIGRPYTVKDAKGTAGSHPITILAPVGVKIDGQATCAIGTNYGTVTLMFNGAGWSLL